MTDELSLKILRRLDLILAHGQIAAGGKVTLTTGEALSGVPVVTPYGLHSAPPAGTQAVFASSGTRDTLVCLGTESTGPKVGSGEVMLYAGDTAVHLSPQGKVVIKVGPKNLLKEILDALSTIIQTPTVHGKPLGDPNLIAKLTELSNYVA